MRFVLIAAILLVWPARAEPPAQIKDASFGFFTIPQLSQKLYPPAVESINSNDTTNLDLALLSINPRNQIKVLAMFGDSRASIFGMSYRFPMTVYSFARSGSTTSGVVNRLENLRNISSANPEHHVGGVFILVGVNDVLGTNYEFSNADFKSNYRRIAAYLRQHLPNVPVVLSDVITLNSVQPKHRERDYDTIDDYNNFLRELCIEQGWRFMEFNPLFAKSDRSLKPEFDMDGIHLNKAANDIIYERVIGYFAGRF